MFKFLFNLILLVVFVASVFIGYRVTQKNETIAEAIDSINNMTSDGKISVAESLLKRELNRRVSKKELRDFGHIKCFSDNMYGTSCKVSELETLEKKKTNVFVYNVYPLFQVAETRTGFTDLKTKIRFEFNPLDMMDSYLSVKPDNVPLNKREIANELVSLMKEESYLEVYINSKKYKYGDVLFNGTIKTGTKKLNFDVDFTLKFNDKAVSDIEDIIKNHKNNYDMHSLYKGTYFKKVSLSIDAPSDLIMKVFFMSNAKDISYSDFQEIIGNLSEEEVGKMLKYTSQFYGLDVLKNSIFNNFAKFLVGNSDSYNLTISSKTDNLDLYSIITKKATIEDLTIR